MVYARWGPIYVKRQIGTQGQTQSVRISLQVLTEFFVSRVFVSFVGGREQDSSFFGGDTRNASWRDRVRAIRPRKGSNVISVNVESASFGPGFSYRDGAFGVNSSGLDRYPAGWR
jgi:hypothetical protein